MGQKEGPLLVQQELLQFRPDGRRGRKKTQAFYYILRYCLDLLLPGGIFDGELIRVKFPAFANRIVHQRLAPLSVWTSMA